MNDATNPHPFPHAPPSTADTASADPPTDVETLPIPDDWLAAHARGGQSGGWSGGSLGGSNDVSSVSSNAVE